MLWPKKNSYKEFDNEKESLRLENSPTPPNVSYIRISHKRPSKMPRVSGGLQEVLACGGRTAIARAKFLSQPRMGWYIYSKKIMKVTFSYQLLVVLLPQSSAILCDSSFTKVHLIR